MSINRAILMGNVGADPEIRSTGTGDRIATLRLATSETWKDKATGERKEATEWHTVVIFNDNVVGVVERFVKKGSRIAVEGMIKHRKWQDKTGADRWSTEIVIGRFDGQLSLEGDPKGSRTASREERGYGDVKSRGAEPGRSSSGSRAADLDDDIPF
jgi:single-strand DNA-binding protein